MKASHRFATTLPLLVVLGLLLTVFSPLTARAHEPGFSTVLLDVGADQVRGEIQLPMDRLDVALDEDLAAADAAVVAEHDELLRTYVGQHVSASGVDGAMWRTTVGAVSHESIDEIDHVVVQVGLAPETGPVTDFVLHYDVIVHYLQSHKIVVAAGPTDGERAILGTIDFASTQVTVQANSANQRGGQSLTGMIGLGFDHVTAGADHLLFLIVLLLPAPLRAVDNRWHVDPDTSRWRSLWRVVHVATAFTVGHSLTLIASVLGWVSVPSNPVEIAVALSIGVGAVHAVRPLVAHGEALIAGVFGLVHGLAFAGILDNYDLATGATVRTLLGFNLGVELAQLATLALIFPSFLLLSRTPAYRWVRVVLAVGSLAASIGWVADRTGQSTNPLEPMETFMVRHPLVVAASLAIIAVAFSVRSQLVLR